MLNQNYFVPATLFIFLLFFLSLRKSYGSKRAFLISLIRLALIIPLILALKPIYQTLQQKISLQKKTLKVFFDDSESMTQSAPMAQSNSKKSNKLLSYLERKCAQNDCQLQASTLSSINPLAKKGFSPLREALLSFYRGVNEDPSLLLTDGEDSLPNSTLKDFLLETRSRKGKKHLISFLPKKEDHLWIETFNVPQFGFHTESIMTNLHVKRSGNLEAVNIQAQVFVAGKIVESKNLYFPKGASEINETITLQPLQKGSHLLSVKILDGRSHSTSHDSIQYQGIEILPDTKGILHLLGAPSWDGRFLRRHLKSEPKYDLISFYILRNPGDIQEVPERELSLIPFPVHRLFTEELKNFHLVIMHNFALFEFLAPLYQKNLVNFVKKGGSLLFIGGPKALSKMDLKSSPLKEIFPLNPKSRGSYQNVSSLFSPVESSYNEEASFNFSYAKPSEEQIHFASVYLDFLSLKNPLFERKNQKGLNVFSRGKLENTRATPLLEAQLEDKSLAPLALASYPEKGRALWFLTDSLWKLALNPKGEAPRSLYNKLMSKSLAWLLRSETYKPLTIQQSRLEQKNRKSLSLHMKLSGPSIKYFESEKSKLNLMVCSKSIKPNHLKTERKGNNLIHLEAEIGNPGLNIRSCKVKVELSHPAFGKEKASSFALIPKRVEDKKQHPKKSSASKLAESLGAELSFYEETSFEKIWEWTRKELQQEKAPEVSEAKIKKDHYWPLRSPWMFLLLLLLPIEVILRKR